MYKREYYMIRAEQSVEKSRRHFLAGDNALAAFYLRAAQGFLAKYAKLSVHERFSCINSNLAKACKEDIQVPRLERYMKEKEQVRACYYLEYKKAMQGKIV